MNISTDSKSYRWIIMGIVMLGTFMAILDSSIVNVVLPRMMNTFQVNRNQIEWVTTGFMLAAAVVMPLVGFLTARIGYKALYLGSLTIFTIGSAACAFAWSYESLIVARIIQAVGGGATQPISMVIITDLFEPEERGKAIGIWATGVMVGPALGPTAGGYLTEWFNWRVIFSINLPIGIIVVFLGILMMKSQKSAVRKNIPFDWWGFITLSMAVISGLLSLSKGQEKGWDSNYIYTCYAFCFTGFVLFLAIESTVSQPLLDLRIFKFRNFSLSMLMAPFRSVGLFGGVFLIPIFLQNLSGYSTIQTGLLMMPGAIVLGIMMPIAGRLTDSLNNPRLLVSAGTIITGFSLLMYSRFDTLSSTTMIIVPQLVRGVGIALMMAPLSTAAINAIPPEKIPMGSSFLNVIQRIGGSFGIALLNTHVTNAIFKHTMNISESIGTQSAAFQRQAMEIGEAVARYGQGLASADRSGDLMMPMVLRHLHNSLSMDNIMGMLLSFSSISRKASVMGFDDGFLLGGFIILAALPICFFLKPGYPTEPSQQ